MEGIVYVDGLSDAGYRVDRGSVMRSGAREADTSLSPAHHGTPPKTLCLARFLLSCPFYPLSRGRVLAKVLDAA